jgi:hypothetical protein
LRTLFALYAAMAAAYYAAALIRACGPEMRQLVAQANLGLVRLDRDVTQIDDVIIAVSVTPHASVSGLRRRGSGCRRPETHRRCVAGSRRRVQRQPQGFNAALERIKEQARMGRTTPK